MQNIEHLPSPLASVATRLRILGHDQTTDTFMATSYLCEAALKLIGICLHSGFGEEAAQHAYRLAYNLIRADGLGSWPSSIELMTSMPLASFLPAEFAVAVEWYTKKRTKPDDEWCRTALIEAHLILDELAVPSIKSSRENIRTLVSLLVQIRNKTKAHGALGPDFYQRNNPRYIAIVWAMIDSCPLFAWDWFYLSHRPGKALPRGVKLLGVSPQYMSDREVTPLSLSEDGVYIQSPSTGKLFFLGELLSSSRECRIFGFPNGNYSDANGTAEVLDYTDGSITRADFRRYRDAPAPLPPSETEGLSAIDVQSNIFGNLPGLPNDYVKRPLLESELSQILCDQNHSIVTLHGNGGMGKTYLALAVAHELAEHRAERFENIVWFSARDLDLKLSGARAVKPQVVTLKDVCLQYGKLFGTDVTSESFAKVLQGSARRDQAGTLFIFDNFETMQDLTELHRYLDQHTTIPNKTLLTSRERAFKADYPIEVKGMEFSEATVMVEKLARDLHAESLLTPKVMQSIYDQTKGHPYVMKVLVGEMAKERRYLNPVQVLSSRTDVAQAIFERSFIKLSDSARGVFLTVANWKSYISELSLLVVLGIRGVDVDSGLDECLRLSLIYSYDRADGEHFYYTPELARNFGKKKLEGDPDRIVIQADIEVLRQFGVTADPKREGSQIGLIKRFISWCKEEAKSGDPARVAQIDVLLETLASLWPAAWLDVSIFRRMTGAPQEAVETALRRAVEENPTNSVAWIARAEYAKSVGNAGTYIASLVSAVDARPQDAALVKEAAYQLTRYVLKEEVPPANRYLFLANVRQHLEALKADLDAVGLSRLAWLYILENDPVKGREYALEGLKKEPGNNYCQRIIEQLSS